jgi:hypothetical protein
MNDEGEIVKPLGGFTWLAFLQVRVSPPTLPENETCASLFPAFDVHRHFAVILENTATAPRATFTGAAALGCLTTRGCATNSFSFLLFSFKWGFLRKSRITSAVSRLRSPCAACALSSP